MTLVMAVRLLQTATKHMEECLMHEIPFRVVALRRFQPFRNVEDEPLCLEFR